MEFIGAVSEHDDILGLLASAKEIQRQNRVEILAEMREVLKDEEVPFGSSLGDFLAKIEDYVRHTAQLVYIENKASDLISEQEIFKI